MFLDHYAGIEKSSQLFSHRCERLKWLSVRLCPPLSEPCYPGPQDHKSTGDNHPKLYRLVEDYLVMDLHLQPRDYPFG